MNYPFTFINVAMTADGKIDTRERRGAMISSPLDKQRVDKLRASADAIMVGGHTVLGDDPKLTVRSQSLQNERIKKGLLPHPTKVAIVTNATIRPDAQFLTAGPSRIIIFTTHKTAQKQLDVLKKLGVEIFVHDGTQVDLQKALQTLYGLGIKRLLVEGGATLNFELIRQDLVDEIYTFIAPLIFGGKDAPTLAAGAGLERENAIHVKLLNVEKFADGILARYQVEKKR